MYPYQNMNMNVLPQQQILQANGKTSIDALRMSPNSSVLIADQTKPIIWKCVSDSLGNVTATPFDISPHKDEAQVEKEQTVEKLNEIVERLNRLEQKYESFTFRSSTESADATTKVYIPKHTENAQPDGVSSNHAFSKPKG